MAEPPQPPPTAPVPASTSPIEAVKQEASLKTDQSQAKAPEADKKDRKPDEPESALREVGARLQEAAASKTWKGPEARPSTFRIRRGRKSRGSQPQRRGSKTKDCWTYCARHRSSRTKSLWTTSGVSVSKSDRARTRLPRSSFRESRHWKPDLGSAPEPGRNRLHPLQPVKRANLEGEMLRHAVTRPRATATCGPPAMGDLRHRRS